MTPFVRKVLRDEVDVAVGEVDDLLVVDEGDASGLDVVKHPSEGQVPLRELELHPRTVNHDADAHRAAYVVGQGVVWSVLVRPDVHPSLEYQPFYLSKMCYWWPLYNIENCWLERYPFEEGTL